MSDEFDPLKAFKDLFQRKSERKAPEIPATRKLLDWLEGLDHQQRCKRMIEIGKEARSADQAIAMHANKILDELQEGHFYERTLALKSCQGSHDSKRIFGFTKDASRYLRNLARNIAVLYCEDEQMLEILNNTKGDECKSLLKRLNRNKRQALIDKFIESIKESRTDDFRPLCFFASEELVKTYIAGITDTLGPPEAARFSYQHPEICANFLESYASTCRRGDMRLLGLFRAASKWLAELKPERAVNLIDKLMSLYSANQLVCNLVFKKADAMTRLFSKQQGLGGADLSCVLHKLPEDLLLQTLRDNRNFAYSIGMKLKRLPPTLRLKVFEICKENWNDADSLVAAYYIEALPKDARIVEAKKNLANPVLSSRLAKRLEYVRLLDWQDVKAQTSESINSPETESRGQGLYALCYALKFNRKNLADVLELLHKRKNEADPVRLAFLSALAGLAPSVFKAENLPALGLLFDDALAAQDLSFASLQYIGRLCLRLYNSFPDFAGERIESMLQNRGAYFLSSNPCWLNDEETESFSRFLSKPVAYWIKKEQLSDLQNLARWLGRRLPHSQPANDALFYLCKQGKDPTVSQNAARLLHDYNQAVFAKFLPELLKQDESWGSLSIVYRHLGSKQQARLTPYLGQSALVGRFATGKTKLVPDFTRGFHRWTGKQQSIYSMALQNLLQNKASNLSDRFFGVCRLCLMPEPAIGILAQAAEPENNEEEESSPKHSLGTDRQAVRDFIIRQLANTDNDCGVRFLIECLQDERARQAVYALRSAILAMEANTALKLLQSVPREKVSIFKEIVRIAGDTRSKEAFDWLIDLEATDLHRDVRIALLRALWNFPEQQETWQILRKTVSAGDKVFVDTATRYPVSNLSTQARANLLSLYRDALQNKDSSARIRTMQIITVAGIIDAEQILTPELKTVLNSDNSDEYLNASKAILALYAGRYPEVLTECLIAVLNKPRNLKSYVQQIQAYFSRHTEPYQEDVQLLCKALKTHPQTIELQVSLAGAILPWTQFGEMLLELEKADQLHFGAMQSASQCLSQPAKPSELEKLEQLELSLKSQKSEKLRRLALSALIGAANVSGWTEERLARLQDLRKDSSLLVSSAAIFTLPAKEFAQS